MPELLEVHDPDGAFARIEGWLAERGFFGPGSAGLVAELYLGYGLSEAIRRGTEPPPPEPCRPLPLAACRVGGDVGRGSRGSYAIGTWEQTWTGAEYGATDEEVRTAIARAHPSSSSSRGAETASARCRSRKHGRRARPPISATRGRTRPSAS